MFSEVLGFSWQTGNLIPTQQQGVITLLPKPNKNHQDISNYRPIILLNVDYKIISKVISHRMRKYLPILIHPDQNDFLKGRSIGNNVRLLFNIMDCANHQNIPGALLLLDIQKAFDSVDWVFIRKVGYLKFLVLNQKLSRG